jgi:hypothetical protein
MVLPAQMNLPAVLSVICESISIAINRSVRAAVTIVAAATAILGGDEGRGSRSVILGSHHFVHRRSRFARGVLDRGHDRLLVAVGYIYWGDEYRRSAATRIVARVHAANGRSYNFSSFVEVDIQIPCYLLSDFLFLHH